ncbi:MAG: tetratricopeptide repeat protein [Pirellulales bacterium]
MANLYDMLQTALRLHQAGDLAQAEALYGQVLAAEPRQADAHHLLGMIALARNELEQAVKRIRAAIECNAMAPHYHYHLGTALLRAGRTDEAIDSYRQAVLLDPNSPPLHIALGTALRTAGQPAQAEASFRAALRLAPLSAEAQHDLGNVLHEQERLEEAAAAFERAAELRPAAFEPLFNLGNCCKDQGRMPAAIAAYRRALTLRNDFALLHQNLGLALLHERQFDEAIVCHRRAIELEPGMVEAHNALGVALQMSGNPAEAVACYRRALALAPGDVTAQYDLASALHLLGELDEASHYYRAVLAVLPEHHDSRCGLALVELVRGDAAAARTMLEQIVAVTPQWAEARFFRGTILLSEGEFAEGWPEFEYRLQRPGVPTRTFSQPRWNGAPLEGRTLLVHSEYGYGDMLQFIRYDALVRRRAHGGKVLVEVHPAIVDLLVHSGFRDLVPQGGPPPEFDVQIPMMSLPGLFQTTLATIPADVPYLYADSRRIERWRERLAAVPGFRIGIQWQGNPQFSADRLRSFPLAALAPIFAVPGVSIVSLQKGPGREQLAAWSGAQPIVDLADEIIDFHDTAAVVRNLNLVITCDSSPAHVAGAMNVPVWIALCSSADWRWLRDREDSPWYPSVRLFRQTSLGDWQGVFERMAERLAGEVSAARP